MRRTFLATSLWFAIWALAGTSAAAAPELPDLTAFSFLRLDPAGQPVPVSAEMAAEALLPYDAVLFGEWHDHPGNHLAEMALFRALQARSPKLALSLEMFERDVQPVLDDYLQGRIGEDALRTKGRAWGNYAESYRPLVEFAKEHALAVIAANAPAGIVRCVGQEGPAYLSRLAPAKRASAAAELHLEPGTYRDKFFHFLDEDGSHGADQKALDASGQPTPAALRGFAAQIIRDDTMAESMALFFEKNPGTKLVHLTGDFHVENYLGTAERLRLRMSDLKIAVITPVDSIMTIREHVRAGDIALLLKPLPELYANAAEKKASEDQIRAIMGRARSDNRCAS
jgi:uncharacterized iron-regulated protein